MTFRISTKWYKGCTTADSKKRRKETIVSCKEVLDVLVSILETELETVQSNMLSETNYSLPAWREFQADHIGTIRTLSKVLELVKLKGDKPNV